MLYPLRPDVVIIWCSREKEKDYSFYSKNKTYDDVMEVIEKLRLNYTIQESSQLWLETRDINRYEKELICDINDNESIYHLSYTSRKRIHDLLDIHLTCIASGLLWIKCLPYNICF